MLQDRLPEHIAINSKEFVQLFSGGVVFGEEEETNEGDIILLTNHLR